MCRVATGTFISATRPHAVAARSCPAPTKRWCRPGACAPIGSRWALVVSFSFAPKAPPKLVHSPINRAFRRVMYAVIETGGKQYRVELGSEFAVERLEGTPGDTIKFDRVLLVADGDKASIGTPVVDDALVTASLVRQDRGEKVIVFKYRPKARH